MGRRIFNRLHKRRCRNKRKSIRKKEKIMAKTPIKKTFLKTWCIGNFYNYQIYEVDAGGEKWLEATPITKGVTRTAENEKILRILLENDAISLNKFWQKVR
jgi:hypothetical protein